MNKIQFVAGFSYNEKLFQIVLFKGRINCLCFDKNGNSYLNLNDDEKAAIIDVVRSLIIDEEKSYYVRDDVVNGRLYKIWCDSINKNYFWKSADGNDYVEDNKVLNMKYNHMPLVVYFRNEKDYEQKLDEKLKKYFEPWAIEDLDHIYDPAERIRKKELYVRIGKKGRVKSFFVSGAICLAGIFMLSTLNNIYVTSMEAMFGENWRDDYSVVTVWEALFSEGEAFLQTEFGHGTVESKPLVTVPEETSSIVETVASTEEVDGYQWELIQEAIEKNPNLTDEEKNFIYELRFVFDENHQYMDLDMVTRRLETLRIIYNEESCQENISIGGKYHTADDENFIEIFRSHGFTSGNFTVWLHEFFHVLQCPSNFNLTTELSNELFTREVVRRLHVNGVLEKNGINIYHYGDGSYFYGDGYNTWMNLWYDVVPLINQEYLSEFQFRCDEYLLVRGILKGMDYSNYEYQKVWDFIDLVNSTREYELLIPDDYNDYIYRELEAIYRMQGRNLRNEAAYLANHIYSISKTEPVVAFFLDEIGKSIYLEYEDCVYVGLRSQMQSYFTDAFPESTFHMRFRGNGDNATKGTELIELNGDLGKYYVVPMDADLLTRYGEYLSNDFNRGR